MYTWLEIDGGALRANISALQGAIGGSTLCPVIKANAYGHGLRQVYDAIAPMDLPFVGVTYLSEGQTLRSWGYRGRILVVGPIFPDDLAVAADHDLEVIAAHDGIWRAFKDGAAKPGIHLKIDTGMSRQGFFLEELAAERDAIVRHREHIKGLMSHFANVEDVTEYSYPKRQLDGFNEAKAMLTGWGLGDILFHIASSASGLIMPDSQHSLVRAGIATFGFWPSSATKLSYAKLFGDLLPLKPALSWRSRVIQTKVIKTGQYIGYGCTYKAPTDTEIAVIPVGYYEGYPRLAADNSQCHVLIRGQRCPVLGRICMNMMMVGIGHVGGCTIGDRVTLIGSDGDERITAGDIGTWSGTIHYEVVTRLNPALERRLVASPA